MKKSYNPFLLWGFWVGGVVGAVALRLILGKGHTLNLWSKCTEGIIACSWLGISMNAVYGALIGLFAGYLLHIGIRSIK